MTIQPSRVIAPTIASLVLLLASVAGCNLDVGVTKADARLSGGIARNGGDLCKLNGWYRDGVCDRFCPHPDPDCAVLGSNGCIEDLNCLANQICDSSQCIRGNRDNPSCSSDGDCPAGNTCTAVGCVDLGQGPTCELDTDCADDDEGELCYDGRCIYTSCCENTACPEGAFCAGAYCRHADGSRAQCSADRDCGPHGICTGSGYCSSRPGCLDDAGCEPGQVCYRGSCIGATCLSDDDCTDGTLCDLNTGACLLEGPGAPCIDDSTCGPFDRCLNGACTTSGGEITPCTADSDCPARQVCLAADHCGPRGAVGEACASDAHCLPGLFCHSGTCVGCTSDSDCDDDQACGADRACVPAPGTCRYDVDCGYGRICGGGGFCDTGTGGSCVDDVDCPPQDFCINGVCSAG